MTEMPREIPLSSGRGIVLACLMTFDRDLRSGLKNGGAGVGGKGVGENGLQLTILNVS
jgi:hypothetical protein